MPLCLRILHDTDSFTQLTELLHRAYAPLAQSGLRFLATHQSEQTTRERCTSGICYLALVDGQVIGTVTYYAPGSTSGSPWLDRAGVASFGQLAVAPEMQGRQIGRRLIAAAEACALTDGAEELALDTAATARHLVAWYERLGFRPIEFVKWSVTNYRSVVMSKSIAATAE